MTKRFALAILLVFLAHAAHAQSILSLNPSFAPSACPYPATAATDGCNAALAVLGSLSGASAYNPNGFNDWRQIGQILRGMLGGEPQSPLPPADE